MMARIILTVTTDLSTDQRMLKIAAALNEIGYDVLLVGRKRRNSIPLKQMDFKIVRFKCFWEKGFLFYADYNLRLFFFLLRQKCDVICSIDLDTIIPGKIVRRLKRAKHFYDAHEYFSESPEIARRPILKKFWEIIAKFTIPSVDGAYTVNGSLAGIMSKRYGRDFSVIRNLPTLDSNPKHKSETNIILYQGVLNEGRGLELLIDAMSDIDNKKLYLAGGGDIKDELEQRVVDRNVGDRVFFLGVLTPNELKEQTKKAWLGINILEGRSKNYYFSLANKHFDYMMAGVPSLAMNFPEYKLINEQFEISYLIEKLDKQTIVDAVNKLDADPVLYNRLKLHCASASQKFNWESEKQVLRDFYESLLRNSSKV